MHGLVSPEVGGEATRDRCGVGARAAQQRVALRVRGVLDVDVVGLQGPCCVLCIACCVLRVACAAIRDAQPAR